jgi:hypothetical protein
MPLKKQHLWPDVGRLLRKRREFVDLADKSVANSATAFLAWKALLIVSYTESVKEQDRCATTVSNALENFTELWEDADKFVSALQVFERASPRQVAEWYCDSQLDAQAREKRVEWARRTIKLLKSDLSAGTRGKKQAQLVASHMYAMRNAVIAHAAVHSSDMVFQRIVPCFEHLTCRVTCGSYALRAAMSLEDAMRELGIK